MKLLLWILSKIFPVYWEVTKWGYNCSGITHFLTREDAENYCRKQSCDCIIDKYINCRPTCLIKDNRVHHLVTYKGKKPL